MNIIFFLTLPCILCSDDLVSLKLTSTGCEHNCQEYADNSKCSSSINVNGEEKSLKKDGFNIAVIDNFSGKITTAHFRWFAASPLFPSEREKFRDFFKGVKSNAVVIVVFQNMCNYLALDWYSFLLQQRDMMVHRLSSTNYFTATLVVCKKSCPRTIEGTIPYSYSSPVTQNRHMASISFHLRSTSTDFRGDNKNKIEKGKDVSVVIVSSVVGVLVVGLLVCLLVYKRIHQHENSTQRNMERNNGPEKGPCGTPHESLCEELLEVPQVKTDCYNHSVANAPSAPPLCLYSPSQQHGNKS